MMKRKVFRLFWVVLLVISSFSLGYSLRPKTSRRPPALDMRALMNSGRFRMPPPTMSMPERFQPHRR